MVLLHSNRSLCYFKLGKVDEAFADADESVNIDPTFAKGWVRRATAQQANGHLKDALVSYDEAIKLEPEAKAYQKARAKVKSAIKDTEKKRGRGESICTKFGVGSNESSRC